MVNPDNDLTSLSFIAPSLLALYIVFIFFICLATWFFPPKRHIIVIMKDDGDPSELIEERMRVQISAVLLNKRLWEIHGFDGIHDRPHIPALGKQFRGLRDSGRKRLATFDLLSMTRQTRTPVAILQDTKV